MFSRPGPGDTEDDLLRSQQEFVAGRLNPSAAVSRSYRRDERRGAFAGDKREHESTVTQRDIVTLDGFPPVKSSCAPGPDLPPKKRSRFKDRISVKKSSTKEECFDAGELLDIHDRHVSAVLSQIKEREVHYRNVTMPQVSQRGFPTVLYRGNIEHGALPTNDRNGKPEQSLFARQFALAGGMSFGVPEQRKNDTSSTPATRCETRKAIEFQKSSLITGEGLMHHTAKQETSSAKKEIEDIHRENIAKLASMTAEEIKDEQEKLRASLDPSLVTFLTSRCKAKITTEDKTSNSDDINNLTAKKCGGKSVHFGDTTVVSHGGKERMVADHDNTEIKILSDIKVSDKWLHMDKVEYGKLEWMKDCPAPTDVKNKEGYQARFDFNGDLVFRSEVIPEHLGLHHHGDEPSCAGYTLEELFILARSSFLQQRVFALQVLARIVKQDQQGIFHDCVLRDVMPVLLDAGILFLLRWSLDDSSEAVIIAAIQGINAVLTVPGDKEEAEKVVTFDRGLELPALNPYTKKKEKDAAREENNIEQNLTDAELLKKDAVKGLIQMSLLQRLRYILEVWCPPAPAVIDSLTVLIRITRHSAQAANDVFQCPRMIETVIKNFLPLSWKTPNGSNTDLYGLPVSDAMRLMRALCSAGRNMAATLVSKWDLIARVLRYTALDPHDMQLETEEALSLYRESLRTWKVCILYGISCDFVREMYSSFTQHLQEIQSLSLVISTNEEKTRFSCATAILGVIEAAVYAAGACAYDQDELTSQCLHGKDSVPSPVALNWSHVTGFFPLIGECATKWVKEILDCDDPRLEDHNLVLMSGALSVLASFISKIQFQVTHSPIDVLQQVEQLACSVLLPLAESTIMDQCFKFICSASIYNKNARSKLRRKMIPSLPDYGSLELAVETESECKPPVNILIGFLTSVLRLFFQVTKLHKGIASKFTSFLFKDAIMQYLNIVVKSGETSQSFFVREEHHLQYFLIKLVHNVVEVTGTEKMINCMPLWHEVSLSLFSSFFPGDEFYAFDLLSTILFNPKFFLIENVPTSVGVTRDLSQMSLSTEGSPTPILPSTSDVTAHNRGVLVSEAHKNLPRIRSTFMSAFHSVKRSLAASRSLSLHQVRSIKSFLLPPFSGPLHPADWMFAPIVDLYNQAFAVELKGRDIDSVTDPAISIVTATLQFVLLLEECRSSCLRHVSMTARVARLVCVFLTGNDLFLDSGVHKCLSCLLRIYCRPCNQSQLDFSSAVPGLTSFYDLYASLLTQYSAVSFGDSLFACFVVLPLAQRHDAKYRRAVWDEHSGVLRALSLPLDQLPLSLDEFLYPVEQSDSLLSLYLRALATQTVRPEWSPLFYLIAVHHVNAFVFQRVDPAGTPEVKRKLALLKQVLSIKNEIVRHDVLYYYKPAGTSSSNLLEKFSILPPDRELLLRHRDSLQECRKMYQKMRT